MPRCLGILKTKNYIKNKSKTLYIRGITGDDIMKPSLQAINITKLFPGVKALTDVSIDFYPGEVHALVGENGAGKSTLINILSGVYTPTEGKVKLFGEYVELNNPREALDRGISVIHQELSIAGDLTVAENIFLGEEQTKSSKNIFLDNAAMNKKTQELLQYMHVDNAINATSLADDLTAAEQQMVEIARVIKRKAQVVIMDEPTSSLSELEIKSLFEQINILKNNGATVIYISHRMQEIFDICDRVTVLRDGVKVRTDMIKEITEQALISSMVGREIKDYFIHADHPRGSEMLRVENLSRKKEFKNISFTAYQGEILGISGLVGSGRTEILETVFGERKADSGKVFVKGEEVAIGSPSEAIGYHIGLVTEDRRTTGLMLKDMIKKNIVLPSLINNCKSGGFLDIEWENKIAKEYMKKLNIKAPGIATLVQNLSGGNQQKVVLAKWMVAQSQILLLDEPTRGIDVNAKTEFYSQMSDFVAEGGCIVMVSSELPEILGVCDRIIVMREGEIRGELSRKEASEETIMAMAAQTSIA